MLALLLATSCAKKGPPLGGPPDIEPPRIVGTIPDSGAAGVAREGPILLTFSEPMEPRSTGDAVSIAPRVDIRQRRWSHRTLTLVLAESLRTNHTYTMFLGGGARDQHGNPISGRTVVVFTTAATMSPGVLAGRLDARGFSAGGTYLWCYDAGHEPDSTARDFDAVGMADMDGTFRIVGLPVPGRYKLWVFADLNGNRSFEPQIDILAPVDSAFSLSAERPAASRFVVSVVNPRAPGRVRGTVLDSLAIQEGSLAVVAIAADDSTRRVPGTVDERGAFDLQLAAGTWLLRAWRDLDRNHTCQPATEPASEFRRIEVAPAADIVEVKLVLVRPGRR